VDSAYEPPSMPDVRVKAGELTPDECIQQIVQYLLISTIFFYGIYFPLLLVKIHS